MFMKQSLIEWVGQAIMAFACLFALLRILDLPYATLVLAIGIATMIFGYKWRES